ncbi:hypothetical protein DEO45_07760 [Rhodanobacter denitrificans]|uniref:Uncharacterized protein n=1 Tax=Rhodanobacter denitrificans TaxID=666685 RepID=A0A368KG34_9GAMM|nr:hypothetical protein [Rhodanobacter denitrificans]RCS29965.1 hypothetical protein DEO45_07760 [Rhodanobacter denitrificans]
MPASSNPLHAAPPHASLQDILGDAIRYWEVRRIAYNLALALVVAGWVMMSWPGVLAGLRFQSVLALFVLAVLANVCYCAAYLVDIAAQYSPFRAAWRHGRWALWLIGTLFAMTLAYYWLADEMAPAIGAAP